MKASNWVDFIFCVLLHHFDLADTARDSEPFCWSFAHTAQQKELNWTPPSNSAICFSLGTLDNLELQIPQIPHPTTVREHPPGLWLGTTVPRLFVLFFCCCFLIIHTSLAVHLTPPASFFTCRMVIITSPPARPGEDGTHLGSPRAGFRGDACEIQLDGHSSYHLLTFATANASTVPAFPDPVSFPFRVEFSPLRSAGWTATAPHGCTGLTSQWPVMVALLSSFPDRETEKLL